MSAIASAHGRPIVLRPGVVWHEHNGRELHLDQRLDGPTLRLVVAALDEARLDSNEVVLMAVQPGERRVAIEYVDPPFDRQVEAWKSNPLNRDEDFDPVTRVASVVIR